jgi:ribonuclease HI
VPGHAGVEENEQTDQVAKQAVVRSFLPQDPGELSLVHIQRELTEIQTEEH